MLCHSNDERVGETCFFIQMTEEQDENRNVIYARVLFIL